MTHIVLILGMTAVTYLPRLAPFLLLRNAKLHPFIEKFLQVLPICALGALLFPDLLDSIPGKPLAACAGVFIAGAVSLTKGGLLLSVIAGVAASYLVIVLTG